MTRRYTLDANSGLLVDRDGNSLGRVVSITLEPPDGGSGGNTVCPSSNDRGKGQTTSRDGVQGKPKTVAQVERAAIDRIWGYWLEISHKNQKLDAKRERIIRNALRLVGEENAKRALLGLTRSPHHNGQNEQRKTYLEVRYALKGIGDESDDERIEKAMTWAAQFAPDAQHVDPAKVQRDLDAIRYTLGLEHRPERERATAAWKRLTAAGFTLVKLSQPPFVRLER